MMLSRVCSVERRGRLVRLVFFFGRKSFFGKMSLSRKRMVTLYSNRYLALLSTRKGTAQDPVSNVTLIGLPVAFSFPTGYPYLREYPLSSMIGGCTGPAPSQATA